MCSVCVCVRAHTRTSTHVCVQVCAHVCMYIFLHCYCNTVPATVSNLTGTATDENCIIRDQDNVLTCTYDGVPQPSVLWYTLTGDNRVNIPASDADYVVTITPTETVLTIRDVDSEDAGTYGCEATNTVNGSVMVNHMEIDVIICSKLCACIHACISMCVRACVCVCVCIHITYACLCMKCSQTQTQTNMLNELKLTCSIVVPGVEKVTES